MALVLPQCRCLVRHGIFFCINLKCCLPPFTAGPEAGRRTPGVVLLRTAIARTRLHLTTKREAACGMFHKTLTVFPASLRREPERSGLIGPALLTPASLNPSSRGSPRGHGEGVLPGRSESFSRRRRRGAREALRHSHPGGGSPTAMSSGNTNRNHSAIGLQPASEPLVIVTKGNDQGWGRGVEKPGPSRMASGNGNRAGAGFRAHTGRPGARAVSPSGHQAAAWARVTGGLGRSRS